MSAAYALAPTFTLPKATAAGGTPYGTLIPPRQKKVTKVLSMGFTSGAGQQTVNFLSPQNLTGAALPANAGQSNLTLLADPGVFYAKRTPNNPIAIGDYIAWKYADGTMGYDRVTAVAGFVVTLANPLPSNVQQNAPVWFFGVPGDVNPNTGYANTSLTPPVGATTPFGNTGGTYIVAQGNAGGEPMLVLCANAANQSSIDSLSGIYGP